MQKVNNKVLCLAGSKQASTVFAVHKTALQQTGSHAVAIQSGNALTIRLVNKVCRLVPQPWAKVLYSSLYITKARPFGKHATVSLYISCLQQGQQYRV
jgi:DNA-binding transcriptional regulator YdaS (Cro superfamily)